jgi:hypothetical protein
VITRVVDVDDEDNNVLESSFPLGDTSNPQKI